MADLIEEAWPHIHTAGSLTAGTTEQWTGICLFSTAMSYKRESEMECYVLAKSPGEICQMHKVNYITHPLNKERGKGKRKRETDPKSSVLETMAIAVFTELTHFVSNNLAFKS